MSENLDRCIHLIRRLKLLERKKKDIDSLGYVNKNKDWKIGFGDDMNQNYLFFDKDSIKFTEIIGYVRVKISNELLVVRSELALLIKEDAVENKHDGKIGLLKNISKE